MGLISEQGELKWLQKQKQWLLKKKKQVQAYLQSYIEELDRTDAMYEKDFAHLDEKLADIESKNRKQREFVIKQNLL